MTESNNLDELMACRLDEGRKVVEPCTIVIFGASGDLTARKLIPALYHLYLGKQLPKPVRIIGFARREKADEQWWVELRAALNQFSRTKPVDDAVWTEFAENISYCVGDFSDANAFTKLKEQLAGFYLLEARDLNEAIQMASKIPPARQGSVEVRPVRDFDEVRRRVGA